jgi:hypothetical protein
MVELSGGTGRGTLELGEQRMDLMPSKPAQVKNRTLWFCLAYGVSALALYIWEPWVFSVFLFAGACGIVTLYISIHRKLAGLIDQILSRELPDDMRGRLMAYRLFWWKYTYTNSCRWMGVNPFVESDGVDVWPIKKRRETSRAALDHLDCEGLVRQFYTCAELRNALGMLSSLFVVFGLVHGILLICAK